MEGLVLESGIWVPKPGHPESPEETSEKTPAQTAKKIGEVSLYDNWRRLVVGSLVGAMALTGLMAARSSAGNQQPMEIGVATQEMFDANLSHDEALAARMKQAGVTAVRVFPPFTRGSAEVQHDKDYFCDTAIAAHDNGLAVYYDWVGWHADGTIGYMPKTYNEMLMLETKMGSAMFNLQQCAPDFKNINFEIGDEPDKPNSIFVPKAYTAGDYVKLLDFLYPRLSADADVLDQTLTIGAGNLAFADIAYVKAMAQAMKDQGITWPIFDKFNWHPYPTDHSNPLGQIALFPQMAQAVNAAFPWHPKLSQNEFGIDTNIPPSKKKRYIGSTPDTVLSVREDQQAKYYCQALGMVAQQPYARSLFIYRWTDEPQLNRWHSGLFYASDPNNPLSPLLPKSSYDEFANAALAIDGGSTPKC